MAKNKTNLRTLNAKAELYGNRVTPTTYLRTLFIYEIIALAYSMLLFGPKNIIMNCITAIIIAVFVYWGILPYKVDDSYREHSENQRNQFMHLVTQGLSADNASIVYVLQRATDAASGEFYDDMSHLLIKLKQTSDYETCHAAFQKIADKYKEDIYFSMMIEQCETTFFEAQYHIETYRSLQDAHDTMIAKERYYEQQKEAWQRSLRILIILCLGTEYTIFLLPGIKTYQKVWLNITGIVISIIFFIILGMFLRQFYKSFYDNDVTHE